MVEISRKLPGGGVHGGPSPQLHTAAFAVSSYTEVCAQALQCLLGFVLEGGWDPDKPYVQVGPQFGSAFKGALGLGADISRYWSEGSSKSRTATQWAALVDSAAGLDVCVRTVVIYEVGGGARVPSGEAQGCAAWVWIRSERLPLSEGRQGHGLGLPLQSTGSI